MWPQHIGGACCRSNLLPFLALQNPSKFYYVQILLSLFFRPKNVAIRRDGNTKENRSNIREAVSGISDHRHTKSKANNSDNNHLYNNGSSASTTTSSADGVRWLKGKKRPNVFSALGILGPKSRLNPTEEMQVSSGSSGSVQAPSCRPWDRDDLFRRLSTFKSMTWFAKPQRCIASLHAKSSGWRGSLKFSSMVLKSSLNCRRTLRGTGGKTQKTCAVPKQASLN